MARSTKSLRAAEGRVSLADDAESHFAAAARGGGEQFAGGAATCATRAG